MTETPHSVQNIKLKKARYDEQSSFADLKDLERSVQLINDNVIYIINPRFPTLFQIKFALDLVEKLTKDLDYFYIIIDASNIFRPKSELNKYSKKRFKALNHKIVHISIITGFNAIVNFLIGFLIDIIFGKLSVSVHLTFKKSFAKIELIKELLRDKN